MERVSKIMVVVVIVVVLVVVQFRNMYHDLVIRKIQKRHKEGIKCRNEQIRLYRYENLKISCILYQMILRGYNRLF